MAARLRRRWRAAVIYQETVTVHVVLVVVIEKNTNTGHRACPTPSRASWTPLNVSTGRGLIYSRSSAERERIVTNLRDRVTVRLTTRVSSPRFFDRTIDGRDKVLSQVAGRESSIRHRRGCVEEATRSAVVCWRTIVETRLPRDGISNAP